MTKILTLVGILAIVWFAVRLLGKVQRQREDALRRHGGDRSRGAQRTPPDRKAPGMDAQEMAKCPVCGVYVAAGSARCGTPGCPR